MPNGDRQPEVLYELYGLVESSINGAASWGAAETWRDDYDGARMYEVIKHPPHPRDSGFAIYAGWGLVVKPKIDAIYNLKEVEEIAWGMATGKAHPNQMKWFENYEARRIQLESNKQAVREIERVRKGAIGKLTQEERSALGL